MQTSWLSSRTQGGRADTPKAKTQINPWVFFKTCSEESGHILGWVVWWGGGWGLVPLKGERGVNRRLLGEVTSGGTLFIVKRSLISNQSHPAFSQNLPILNEPSRRAGGCCPDPCVQSPKVLPHSQGVTVVWGKPGSPRPSSQACLQFLGSVSSSSWVLGACALEG